MPSSMIFAGLVVIWLLILLPAVARRRQEVARPSEAALAGRVLDRPRRPDPEVDDMADTRTTSEQPPTRAEARPDDRDWDRPPPRYRPGRGGYDPHAAAAAARARAAYRQRVVLGLLLTALVTGVVAAAALPPLWWAHGGVDLVLVGYLTHLRRQVRLEEAIRQRRAARMAGARRRPAEPDDHTPHPPVEPEDTPESAPVEAADPPDDPDDLLREEPERVPGTGAPLPRIVTSLDELTVESALPRLEPAPPPPLPAGTVLVEELEDDPDQHELDACPRSDYRRAAGE
ncbi:gephyrin-like molybdotransferase receptor GlpR [Pseudonocardia sp. CA-107938]|uniref:gephyrin-like molybdotransferase receptor GlpR n=1 Tax=Pseudonocardia sp. CA-107938 TaxID=3240021 RepID=UPI003D8BD851